MSICHNDWEQVKNIGHLEDNTKIDRPATDQILWRYMSFSSFCRLLAQKELYLTRIDLFDDYREGTITDASKESIKTTTRKVNFSETENGMVVPTLEEISAEDGNFISDLVASVGQMISGNSYYALCWNTNQRESSLFWRGYGKPKPKDAEQFRVAIKTSASKLVESLCLKDPDLKLTLGCVNYKDYAVEVDKDGNIESKVFQKKLEYCDEREVRLAYFDPSNVPTGTLDQVPKSENGFKIPTSLSVLISDIYIEAVKPDRPAARAQPEVVQDAVDLARGRFELVQSELIAAGLSKDIVTISEIL